MKLAEALMERADLQRKAAELKERLLRCAKVQEGDNPPEDPAELLIEFERVAAQLTEFVQRINRTNSATPLSSGVTMADEIATRDNLTLRGTLYRELAKAAVVTQGRITRSEVRFQSSVNVAEIQARADALARDRRDSDARIQAANWLTDLAD